MTGARVGAEAVTGAVRTMHLAVQLPGDPEPTGPPLDFDAYVHLAQTAERGLFDFLLITEGGAGGGGIGAGGPEPFTALNALAAVTDRIGLAAAVTTAGREPYDLARRIAALDRLSAGRAAGPALSVPEFAAPLSPQGRTVVIGVGGPAVVAAPADVVVNATRGPTPPGVKVLARIEFTPAENDPGTGASVTGDSRFGDAAHTLAARLDARVRSGEVDGYVLLPEPDPAGRGLDAFVDRVVPLLQQRGSLRTAYPGTTLRDHLGLPSPVWKA